MHHLLPASLPCGGGDQVLSTLSASRFTSPFWDWRAAWRFLGVRASNEGSLRPRVARAQEIGRLSFFPLPSLPPSPIEGGGQMGPQLRASRDHSFIVGPLRARRTLCLPPFPLLHLLLPAPYNAFVTPWLCDCFLSFAVAQRIRSECGLSIRRASGLQRS